MELGHVGAVASVGAVADGGSDVVSIPRVGGRGLGELLGLDAAASVGSVADFNHISGRVVSESNELLWLDAPSVIETIADLNGVVLKLDEVSGLDAVSGVVPIANLLVFGESRS